MMDTVRTSLMAACAGLVALVAAGTVVLVSPDGSGANLQSNTMISIDECVAADQSETVDIRIHISEVNSLIAWEIYFAYDSRIVEVIDRDVRFFLSEGSNSNVFDLSDPVPNSKGFYRLAAADLAAGATAESGSGVLATITLRTRDEGVSPAVIYRSQELPLGPRLSTFGGEKIGDTNGDEVFDGTIRSGQIAVGEPCRSVAPTADPDLDDVLLVSSPTVRASDGTSSPDPALSPGEASPDRGGSGDVTPSQDATGDGDAGRTPSGPDAGTDGPSESGEATDGPADPGAGPNQQGGGGDGRLTAPSNDTFWAIVLIGGGVFLGLVSTYILARMTRRLA